MLLDLEVHVLSLHYVVLDFFWEEQGAKGGGGGRLMRVSTVESDTSAIETD